MPNHLYHAKRFRKALGHFIGGRAVQASARALLLLTLVRLLNIEDYGAYMLIIGLAETTLQVASLGILPVGQRYLPQMISTLRERTLYLFVGFLALSQLAILFAIAFLLSAYWATITPYFDFSPRQTALTTSAIWLFLLIPAFRFSAEMLDALLEQGKAQIARALMPTARVAGIGVLLLMSVEVTLTKIIIIDIAATALCLILAWSFLSGSLRKFHNPGATGQLPMAEMVRFAWHMAGAGLLGATGSAGALRLVLANALGVAESGLFAFLQSLQRLVGRYLPGTLLRGLIRPILVDRAFGERGMAIVEEGSGLLLKSNLIIVSAGAVAIALAGNDIVRIISGGKFGDAGLTLLLMFLALAVTSQRTVIEMVMQITGHTATLRATALISPIALVTVWLLADYGLNIAVLIIAFTAAMSNWIAMATLIKSTGEFRIDWRGFIAVIVPAAVTVSLGLLLSDFANSIILAIVAVPAYMVGVFLTKPLRKREVAIVESGAGSRIAKLVGNFSSS